MKLVQLMGGEIGVESVLGQGSTFWFTIPFNCDSKVIECLREDNIDYLEERNRNCRNVDENYRVAFAHSEIGCDCNVNGLSVLIVDDNEIQKDAICIQLEHWKMKPQSCSSANEAIEMLKAADVAGKPFSVLIIDNTLVGGTGIKLAESLGELETNDGLKKTHIILLRPLAEEMDQEILSKIGALSISKPVFASALFDALMNGIITSTEKNQTDSGIHVLSQSEANFAERLRSRSAKHTEQTPERSKSHLDGKIHILVVEDNRVNQIVAKNLLEEAGFTCDIAINGHEACSAVREKHYDLVLMDCQMPEMDGYEATDLIRKWERAQDKKRIPIIALTANATKEDIQKCLDSGMDAYCSKPINPQTVLRLIEEWYEKSH